MIDYYVAGPMRGHARWNFPAFREACAYLRDHLHATVISPHELDEAIGFTEDTVELPEGFMHGAMRRDVEALLDVSTILLLPGWHASTGTRFELSVARMLGLEVAGYDPGDLPGSRITSLTWEQVDAYLAASDALAAQTPPLDERLLAERYGDVDDETNPKDRIGITKPQLHLVPRAAIIRFAQAMTDGARKYGPYNWRTKRVRLTVYVSAIERHLAALLDGEDNAADSGVDHLGHIGACCAILIDARETGNLIDDRPPPGPAARLIAELSEVPA